MGHRIQVLLRSSDCHLGREDRKGWRGRRVGGGWQGADRLNGEREGVFVGRIGC